MKEHRRQERTNREIHKENGNKNKEREGKRREGKFERTRQECR